MFRFNILPLTAFIGLATILFFGACASASSETKEEPKTEQAETTAPKDEKASRPSPPKVFEDSIDGVYVRIDYSSPGVKGRQVWGELVKYSEVWRTGANEATKILVDKPVLINGEPLPAGRYGFFTIPEPDQWTLIFNSEPDQWGAFEYNQAQDVLRVKATPIQMKAPQERFIFNKDADNSVGIVWEYIRVPFTIEAQVK